MDCNTYLARRPMLGQHGPSSCPFDFWLPVANAKEPLGLSHRTDLMETLLLAAVTAVLVLNPEGEDALGLLKPPVEPFGFTGLKHP